MRDTPIFLLPGTLCTPAVFEPQVAALGAVARHVEVIAFARESSIDEMADTLAGRLPAGEKAAVAGFSMGGMVAVAFAGRFPERVERLALLNSNVHADLEDRRARRLGYVAEARSSSLRRVLERGFIRNYLHRQEPAHRELILSMAEQLGMTAFEAQSRALAERPDLGAVLAGLECPVLFLGAEHDVLCSPSVQREMLAMARYGQLLMLEDCGHFALLERPEAVNRALRDWYLDDAQSR